MRLRQLVLGALAAALLLGCGQKLSYVKEVTRPIPPRKAVSLSPSTTELFASKFMAVQLVGRTASCNYPEHVKPIQVVMQGVKPNYEAIIAIKPDILLYDPSLFAESDLTKFQEANIPVYPVGGDSIDEFVKRLYELGSDFALETTVMPYIADIERAVGVAKAQAPSARPKTVILLPDGRGAHMVAGVKSFVADVAKTCGADVRGPESNKFEPSSLESLVGWNPDLIICANDYKQIVEDPRLQSLSAIKRFKAGKATIGVVNGDVLLRRGSRVDTLVKSLARFISVNAQP